MNTEIIQLLTEKYKNLDENPETYIKGLIQSTPINYWDYIKTETLLSLQNPRTDYKDEEVFILYNQMTELLLKLILNEIKQITGKNNPEETILVEKLTRINQYMHLLISLFNSIKTSIDYNDYNNFRFALAPASGFQSVQFRYIELHCTSIENLVHPEDKKRLSINSQIEECFEYIYWKEAGINRTTGKKTYTLKQFEDKYQEELIILAKRIKGNTIEDKVLRLPHPSNRLIEQLKEFDKLYNIEWPSVHLAVANYYLNKKGENTSSTGNSEWKNYLHPQIQQRKFFPSFWSVTEKKNWGIADYKNEII